MAQFQITDTKRVLQHVENESEDNVGMTEDGGDVEETEADDVMATVIRLKFSVVRLVEKNIFPYNVQPLLTLIQDLEDLYES